MWLLGPSCLSGRLYGLRARSGTEREAVMLVRVRVRVRVRVTHGGAR